MNPKVKLNRAKLRISELQSSIQKYFLVTPYKVAVRINSENKRPEYYVAGVVELPIEISLLAGEVIQHLRSALDHVAYKAFKVTPNSDQKEGAHISFPIADSLEEYEKIKIRKTKGIPPDVLARIDSLRPYRSGNDLLWRIHKLNNIDKHRLLVTVGSSYGSVNIAPTLVEVMQNAVPEKMGEIQKFIQPIFIQPADRMLPLRVGDVLFVDLPDKQVNPEIQFQFFIAFNEPGLIEGNEIVTELESMCSEVEGVLENLAI